MFGPILYGLVKGLAVMSDYPPVDLGNEYTGQAQPDPIPEGRESTHPADTALADSETDPTSENESAQGAPQSGQQPNGVSDTVIYGSRETSASAGATHTFQVTHTIANDATSGGRSVWKSAELTVDEAIAWIRQRLLES